MKLATIRTSGRAATAAVLVDEVAGTATELVGVPDIGTLLAGPGLAAAAGLATGTVHRLDSVDFAPLVPRPGKIVCVGLNYRSHILEMKRDLPEYPTLFAKFADCLLGAGDAIVLPPESDQIDWEGELGIVIGTSVRRATSAQAEAAIAGYTISNDVSMRDWQFRTREWLQGKMWAESTPLGPVLATPDEIPAQAFITTTVDGVVKQRGDIHDLVHDPRFLVEYISTILPLHPGDVILTGTPGGVGHARTPQEYLRPGQRVTITIDGIGELSSTTVAEQLEPAGLPTLTGSTA